MNTEDRDKLQQALDSLCDWADKWGMSFNLGKCKVMHVGTHNLAYEYFMRGVRLEETEEGGTLAWQWPKTSSPQHIVAKQQEEHPLSLANLEEISTTGTGSRS